MVDFITGIVVCLGFAVVLIVVPGFLSSLLFGGKPPKERTKGLKRRAQPTSK